MKRLFETVLLLDDLREPYTSVSRSSVANASKPEQRLIVLDFSTFFVFQESISTMHSTFASNIQCGQDHFMNRVSFVGTGDILPPITEEAEEEDSDLVVHIDYIAGVSDDRPIEEFLPKPRPRNDLTALMPPSQQLRQRPPRLASRRRLETYVDEDMIKAYQEQSDTEEARKKSRPR